MQKQLDILVEVSRRMQGCAGEGDWETVNHLQEESQQLAGELFAGVITAADAQAVANAVNEILRINKSIMDMGTDARALYLNGMEQFQQGRRAVRKYTENTG